MKKLAAFASATLVAGMLAAPAFGVTQPSSVGNSEGRNGGASEPGPHCHFNLVAGENSNGPFDQIITGTIHEAHVVTGTGIEDDPIFIATTCPST
jgi:hypothetical protein